MERLLVLLPAMALLVACAAEPEWHARDITGLMPQLAFNLTDENGEPVTAADYRGDVDLLFFGYTSCPDVCPATLGQLRAALDRLEPAQRDQVQVLFVSVDPRRDDPAQLRRYTDAFGSNFAGLTGTADQLDAVTKRYRATYGYGEPDEHGNYEVSHSSAVYAFDKTGAVRLLIRESDGAEAIAADVGQLAALR